jgi:hypothetical protein
VARLLRPGVLVAVAGAAAALATAPSAAARTRDLPRPGPLAAPAAAAHPRDAVIARSAPAARAARSGRRAVAYSTADGYRVEVSVSFGYPADPVADQALVDFLGSRVHGPELGGLRVHVATPAEIVRLCGGDPRVVACYAVGEARMYVPGERVGGLPVEYPLTHEYGHHLASWRSNHPWDALDWGAKHWASATRVCAHVARGRLFPGNQGRHYRDDPGEGFADGYAHLHYPNLPWRYNDLMRPGRAGLAAIRRDVLRPWTANRTRTFRGRLGPGREVRRFSIRVSLDGDLALRLRAPAGAGYSVEAQTRGFAAGRGLRSGDGFGVEWCRRRPVEHVTLSVRRERGAGPFALSVEWPG